MVRDDYVPGRGDLIWLTFRPQAGREQSGRRPALVLSPVDYNGRSGLAVVCPVTSRAKGYPFEVQVPEGESITGVVLFVLGMVTGIGMLAWLVWVVVAIIALVRGAVAASNGEYFRYPMTIRFIN